jgi:hypothetical protein
MPNLTSKMLALRFWMTLGALLLVGLLAIQCQPQSSSRAMSDSATLNNHSGSQDKDRSQPDVQTDSATGIIPIALLYEINPWAMVLGSDSPSFALYEDGLVIFIRPAGGEGGPEYAFVKLNEQERNALVASLPTKQFFELEPRYETTLATDQPTTVINLRDEGRLKRVVVYGGLKRTDNDRKEGAPAAFIEIYEKLKGFRPARAARWMPEKVEVMIWPFENAGGALPWPKNWPDTKHPETRKRGTSDDQINYSIYLTPAQYEALKKSVKDKSADALLINGRKWAFSFRFPFPGEDSWRKK